MKMKKTKKIILTISVLVITVVMTAASLTADESQGRISERAFAASISPEAFFYVVQ